MCHRREGVCLFAGFAVLVASVGTSDADLIRLRNGGEIRGKIERDVSIAKADPLIITTLSGTVVAVSRKHIQFATRRAMTVEEYETRRRGTPKTIDAQLDLAEWCREKGMTDERKRHLRQVIDLEPEHPEARRALGYTKHGGEWSTAEERKRARGLVRYKGRFITPEELAILKKSAAESEKEREWAKQVKTWRAWMSHRIADRRVDGTKKLNAITDPDAVTGLSRYLSNDQNAQIRAMYINILANIPGPRSAEALVKQILNDVNEDLRYQALNALRKEQYGTAMGLFAKSLTNPSNVVVNRAAVGLRRVGDEHAIVPLITALATTHRYKVRVADRSGTVGFNTNGSYAGGQSILPPQIEAMLRSGQLPYGVTINVPSSATKPVRTKVITVTRTHQNAEVLKALKKITGQEYGYDQRSWHLWLASTKTGNGPVVKSP